MAVEQLPIEAGQVMMFARSMGDANRIYHDEQYAKGTEPGGIIAPPTFLDVRGHFDPESSLRPKIGEPWLGSGAQPTGTERSSVGSRSGGTGFSAEQHYEYHRHLRPGDVLTEKSSPGKTWEREGRRAGTITFHETIREYYDQHGELVITALREHAHRARGGPGLALPGPAKEVDVALKAGELSVGDTHEEVVVDNLTRTQIIQYAGASGDFNPMHTDEIFATKVGGYPTVFAHGMLFMGMTGMMLTNYLGDGRLTKFGVRFTRQVWPGDTLTAKATVEAIREQDGQHYVDLTLSTTNGDGQEVLSGNATARIDG